MKKRKVFVLGGGGFIGSAIAKELVKRGNYDITIGDNFHLNQNDSELIEFINNNNIRLIHKDFTNPEVFKDLDNNYDDFYMLASMIGVNNTLENPHEIIRVNTALIYNSLEWIKSIDVKNVLFTSTSECYSGTIDKFGYKIPTPESVPLCIDPIDHPRFTYAVTKMLGESGFLNYARVYEFNCKIISFYSTSLKTIISSKSLGYKSQFIIENSSKDNSDINKKNLNFSKTYFHQGTVRSGEYLESPGDLLILGDVNPGAKVSAEGNIIIWGRLLGIAHAGSKGNFHATISALQLRPVQLRIAKKIARGPKEKPQLGIAEQARIASEEIIIYPLETT